jgi:hypothetical protein
VSASCSVINGGVNINYIRKVALGDTSYRLDRSSVVRVTVCMEPCTLGCVCSGPMLYSPWFSLCSRCTHLEPLVQHNSSCIVRPLLPSPPPQSFMRCFLGFSWWMHQVAWAVGESLQPFAKHTVSGLSEIDFSTGVTIPRRKKQIRLHGE